ncbi:MAG: peptidase U32 family protein [Kiritimatiellia bacterium]|jgi:putative protease
MTPPLQRSAPSRARRVELLSPAGSPEAACAAFQYGADAVYLGLRTLSARADAVNFSPGELAGLTALAHSMTPRRSVYVTLNTLLRDADLPAALDALAAVSEARADAVIVQDPAIVRLARHFFPDLVLHASTQMAVHNLAGVLAARDLGFSRVVLARELPLSAIASIARDSDTEIEVFAHGALCYSYSGLCLFSSHASGRSGNRGRCAYCCRENFLRDGGDAPRPHFSMRDLALLPLVPDLVAAGVACLKIEGRMKSPAYVAAVTDLYRRKLDGALSPGEEAARFADLQTLFSRPATTLHIRGRAPASAVMDASAVGHRGTLVGRVEAVRRERGGVWLRFRSSRALERHDGLQVVLPGESRPYGFPVLRLRLASNPSRLRTGTPADAVVEVGLPPDAPRLPGHAPVFCNSSVAVERAFKVGLKAPREAPPRPIALHAALSGAGARLEAAAPDRAKNGAPLFAAVDIPGPLDAARQPEATGNAIRKAFERLGGTRWTLGSLAVDDPEGRFLPASRLNEARRELAQRLDAADDESAAVAESSRKAALSEMLRPLPPESARTGHWSVKLDAADAPQAFPDADEIILELGFSEWTRIRPALSAWRRSCGVDALRLALPPLARDGGWDLLARTVRDLADEGWRHFECADLAGLSLLSSLGEGRVHSLTADAPLTALNRIAKAQFTEWGISRIATSAEDDLANLLSHGPSAPAGDVLLFQHTPLFLAETPPLLNPGQAEPSTWPREGVRFEDRRGRFLRTFMRGSYAVTVDERPFSAAGFLPRLRAAGLSHFRADFRWFPLPPETRQAFWKDLRAGRTGFPFHPGSLERGLE